MAFPDIRDRIVELRRCKPSEIADHPHQWKVHTPQQTAVLQGVLSEIGIADALLVWPSERAGGKLTAFDGHLRKSLDPDLTWPVLVTDLTDAEADLMLNIVDPLAALAQADTGRLDSALRAAVTGDAAVQQFLSELAVKEGIVPPNIDFPEYDESVEDEVEWLECPECHHKWPK